MSLSEQKFNWKDEIGPALKINDNKNGKPCEIPWSKSTQCYKNLTHWSNSPITTVTKCVYICTCTKIVLTMALRQRVWCPINTCIMLTLPAPFEIRND